MKVLKIRLPTRNTDEDEQLVVCRTKSRTRATGDAETITRTTPDTELASNIGVP